MKQRTGKLLTIHKTLQPRDDTDRQHVSRKEGGRGLTNIQVSVDASIQQLEDYINKCRGKLITVTRNNTVNISIKRTELTRKNGKENNCLETSSDKQAKSHTRKHGHG